jgi:UTP--glucose-1-phosphate uridylyltransferase
MHPGLRAAQERMRAAGVPEAGVESFRRLFARLEAGDQGLLPGDELEPLGDDVPRWEDLPEGDPGLLDRTAVIRLNGGLATTMGLSGPKSLLEAKDGRTFLDLAATSVLALRERHGVRLPLVLMDSARTRGPSLAALAAHPDLASDVPPDFLQHREPRLRARDLRPVEAPADPELEWCPPGHGDVYAALRSSGMLGALRGRGYAFAFLANVDNPGAVADPRLLSWFAASGAPLAMEVVRGTDADRKGGHVARRHGRLVLRETAQVPAGDGSFSDVARWRLYNANNLWLRLDAVERVRDLPLIVNRKRLGEADVLQLETAMGAALGVLDGARVVHVPRTRFAPVKTTDDLLLLRSDAYALTADARVEPAFEGDAPAYVELDPRHYGRHAEFERRFPHGPPSLRACRRLVVHGDVAFGRDVVVRGAAEVTGPGRIPDRAVLEGAVRAT